MQQEQEIEVEEELDRFLNRHDAGPASTSAQAAAPAEQQQEDAQAAEPAEESLFLVHKVSNKDTLAGIAIKYNVSVADIKRANGLLSDSALYGRDTIQVPTKLIPLGEELQMLCAQVASGLGRDPVLNAEANQLPASAAVARVARALNIINGDSYPSENAQDVPWWCQCGYCIEDEDSSAYGCRSRRLTGSSGGDAGDVELMERNADGTMFLPPSTSAGGPTRLHARMRQRRTRGSPGREGAAGVSSDGDDEAEGEVGSGLRPPRPHRHRNGDARGPGGAVAGGPAGPPRFMQQLSDLGRALGESTLFQKIKAAANQPVLAAAPHRGPGGYRGGLGDAADGVLSSLREGLLSARNGGLAGFGGAGPALPRSTNATAAMQRSSSQASVPLMSARARKAGGKSD